MNTPSPAIDGSPAPHRHPQSRSLSSAAQRLTPPSAFVSENRGDLRAVERARTRVRDIVAGHDPRLLVVVGPCSIDDPSSALAYAECLGAVQKETEDALFICMRTYFEKPRTTVGWKGWFSDPHVDGSNDVEYGLRSGVELLQRLSLMGIPCAVELLDPLFVPYVGEWVSWAAVGARTTESQVHRQLVSSLDIPVGFKNGTDGSVDVAVDAMLAAEGVHHFPSICPDGRLQLVTSHGNASTHVVLRGGATGPNSDAQSVRKAHASLVARGARNPRVMVDCSHANSQKDYRNQPRVALDVARQVADGGPILGVMLESYLVEGKQSAVPVTGRVRGQSLTDGCIDVKATNEVLRELAHAVRTRR
jgi:3-deoxy-7-phosphoheptulonate synthase